MVKRHLYIFFGWCFVALGVIGIALPVLPTTPFLIAALALFSKSSPRFHQMLLDNPWFGPVLQQWEQTRSMSRKVKYKASVMIVLVFTISIMVLAGRYELQFFLLLLGLLLLLMIWRIKESAE